MAGVKMSDIAQRVGVSVAAVSMALNGRPGVSEAMRERIIAEAEACGYDMRRLSGATEKKKQILVYFVDYDGTENAEYDTTGIRGAFMKGIKETAERGGADIVQAYSMTGHLDSADIPSGTDGILLVNVFVRDNLAEEISQTRLPCVVVGNSYMGCGFHTVSYDNIGMMAQVVRQLTEKGHRRIGFIRTEAIHQNYHERYYGWLCSQEHLGLERGPVFYGQGNIEALSEQLIAWLPQHLTDTTAFVAWNDYLALALIRALRSCGVVPGRDVAVFGFDDMPFAALSDPPLATVRLSETALSAAGMTYLLELIDHPNQPVTHRQLPLELVLRESCCTAPKK